jgi:hypothetical protein
MSGRHRWTVGIASHDNGSTIRKKIAKVAVGKSIGEDYGSAANGFAGSSSLAARCVRARANAPRRRRAPEAAAAL